LPKVANSLGIAHAGEAGPADVGVVREKVDEVFCSGNLGIVQSKYVAKYAKLADLVQETGPVASTFQ